MQCKITIVLILSQLFASGPPAADFMAFQYAKSGDWAGVGRGILVFDLAEYEQMKNSQNKNK